MGLNDRERSLAKLLRDSHLTSDYALPALFERYAATLGAGSVVVYLADLQQRLLVPFLGDLGASHDQHAESLHVDSTLAGRAFQHTEVVTQPTEDGGALRVWLPLLDGTERLGLVSCVVPDQEALEADDGALRTLLLSFAAVAAELVMTKTLYGDTVVRLRRTKEMGLAAEMQWSLLPPLTFANPDVTVSGGIEPAYEVGGDTLDYAVDPHTAHVGIFDAMGHGLRSAQLAALAVAAYRNARRGRLGLARTVRVLDEAVAAAFEGEAFLTGQLAELDTDSGALSWINGGHPEPLLLRGGRLVKELHADPTLPFGLGRLREEDAQVIGAETLEPGDMVLFYSDGVVEARSPEGEFFGAERLVELVTRELAAGLPAPETMRRVINSLLDHQQGQLDDDATMLFVQYRPQEQRTLLP